MKKLMVMMLTVFLVFTYMSLVQAGVDCGTGTPDDSGNFCYSVNDDLTVTITGYIGTDKEVTIPSTVDGNAVTVIGSSAFMSKQLTSVTLPESVKTIGFQAFANNQLTSVTLPDGVTVLGSFALATNQLTSVTIPASVTSIESRALYQNPLETVVIHGNDEQGTIIGDYAFGSIHLTSVSLGEGVVSIGRQAFYPHLITSVTIPGSVTSIGVGAFQGNPGMDSLTSVMLGEGIETIGESAFAMNQLASVTIPDSVTSIGNRAFISNRITSVTIPASVQTIGNNAFAQNKMDYILFESSPTLGTSVFAQAWGLYPEFEGWYTDSEFTSPWDGTAVPTGKEAFAKRKPDSPTEVTAVAEDRQATVSFTEPSHTGRNAVTGYTVNVYVNGVDQSALQTTGDGSPITVTGLTNGTAYTFKVIATNAAGNSLESAASTAVTPVESYSVTYDGNGNQTGSVPTDSNSYTQGSEVTVLDNTGNLVRAGQSFAGWSTASDGSGMLYQAGDTFDIGNADVTLYAAWHSSNADLNALSLSEGTLTPSFTPGTTSYIVDVAYDVSSITVTAAVYDSNASLQVNGASVTSGDASLALDLAEGENTITVEVTAEDGTTKVYTIVVNRAAAPSSNADLNALSLSVGTLTPSFTPGTTSYTVDVAYDVSSITVTAAVYDSHASLQVNGASVTSGDASLALDLAEGENTITVEVTAEDGTTKVYTIVVNRAAAPVIVDEDNEDSENENSESKDPDAGDKSTTEEITVDVESGNDGTAVSTTTVIRTKDHDGRITDEVVLSENSTIEVIQKLREQGHDTASIVIPDSEDEVSEVHVTIPKTALHQLKEGKINLEIKTANAKLTIPASTLAQFDEDIYFRVVPIKDQSEKEQVEERIKLEKMIQEVGTNHEIRILGRPAIIETNVQNQMVWVTMPLQIEDLPSNEQERLEIFNNVVIFIEHSDGTKELISSEVTANADGTWNVEFETEKFSTFSMVHLEGSEQYFAQLEKPMMHQAYISGYADGTFRPDQNITRAEMASLLARNLTTTAIENTEFSDLTHTHWAYDSIGQVVSAGLMTGYPIGQFKPDQAITRAEMAAIVFQWKNLEQLDGSEVFSDTENHWATSIIAAVSNDNVMNGYPDGSFKPDQSLTRAEAVTVINGILEIAPLYGVEMSTWPDVPTHHWAYHAIQAASMSYSFEITDETLVEEVE